jgi:ribosomal protein S18 acetylase RimI-like enzyme
MRSCEFCDAHAQYRDRRTGRYVCLAHARLEVVAAGQQGPIRPLDIRPAGPEDYGRIEELARYFWGETVVDCFGRQYDVMTCPAFLACEGDGSEGRIGVISYAAEEVWDAVVVVMLNILPEWQGRDGGRSLLNAVHGEAKKGLLGRLLVATTNDDLPSLALYQRYGFRIEEVIPGLVARHHGGEFPGFSDILVRDEIRLSCEVDLP